MERTTLANLKQLSSISLENSSDLGTKKELLKCKASKGKWVYFTGTCM